MNQEAESESRATKRHLWPWFVLLAVLLGVLLAVVWVRREVQRLEWQKKVALPIEPGTNSTR